METQAPEYVVTLVNLIREEMSFAADQVVLYNQEWTVPSDERPYIVVEFRDGDPYAHSKTYQPSQDGTQLLEVQTQNVRERCTIRLYSAGPAARVLKQEILFALNSDRAARYMELYNFKIANLPTSFLDVSAVEATSLLNRYDLDFSLLVSYKRERNTLFFDQFQTPELLINP